MMEDKLERNTFGKQEKLCQKKAIEELFSNGKSFTVPYFKVIVLETNYEDLIPVKILIAVPKKNMREAHDRNRIKRLIRESYRIRKHDLYNLLRQESRTINLAFIFIGREVLEYNMISASIEKALQKVKTQIQYPG